MFHCDGINTIMDISEITNLSVSSLYHSAMVLVEHSLLEKVTSE